MNEKEENLRIKELEASLRLIRIWATIEADTGIHYSEVITNLCDTVLETSVGST